jgi:NADH-quinone oxidoreductase subunit M
MLKTTCHVGRNKYKVFADVTVNEGITLVLIWCFVLFWDVSKPITDLITPSLEEILKVIHRN